MDESLLVRKMQSLYSEAFKLHQAGDYAGAIVCYQTILDHFPDGDLALYNLGLAHYALGDYQQAADAFVAAAEINPQEADYWYNAGLALKQAADYERAQQAYNKAATLCPDDVDTWYNLGCCLQAAGDHDGAVAAYEHALALDNQHTAALGNLACCLQCAGNHEQAAATYRELVHLQPDDVAAQYMLDALAGKDVTAPPPEYVAGLFDGYSENFDRDLLDNLSYRVPDLLVDLLAGHIGKRAKNIGKGENIGEGVKKMRVLDLGCGTGLSGRAILPYARSLIGVNLSEKMVVEADKKGCYDQLLVGDVVDCLHNLNEPVDLLLAADVLTYCGDLEPLFGAASTKIRAGGLFCFSTEHEDQPDWQLRPTGRYGHHPEYIHRLAENHGWQVLTAERAKIRKERDGWVIGDLYLLQR